MSPIIETNEGKFFAYADKKNPKRTACMFFRKEVGENKKWKFQKCDIAFRQDLTSMEDWRFLGEISEKIKERLKELNKKIK